MQLHFQKNKNKNKSSFLARPELRKDQDSYPLPSDTGTAGAGPGGSRDSPTAIGTPSWGGGVVPGLPQEKTLRGSSLEESVSSKGVESGIFQF